MIINEPGSPEALKKYQAEGHTCVFEVYDPGKKTMGHCGAPATHFVGKSRKKGLCDECVSIVMSRAETEVRRYHG